MTHHLLIIATSGGLHICQRDNDDWRATTHCLKDQHVTSVIAREAVILAGTTQGVYRSDDLGATWRAARVGLGNLLVRWIAFHPDTPDFEFAGTEPAAIFVSHDGAETWRECREVAALRDQHEWHLPYSAEAGCIRDFAFNGARAYAAAEVGGVLRSDDSGETWRLAKGSTGDPSLDSVPEPFVYPDVHNIKVHPSSPDLVFAATGDGFYRSLDGGAQWTQLHPSYVRALWLDPQDAQHIILGPADDIGRRGRIVKSRDGGQSWQAASAGIDTPMPRCMVERLMQVDDELFAVLSDGRLFAAHIETWRWREVLSDVKSINAVTTMYS
jgi:photosystem II stability/assembly factor-like uncharacterized protein